MIYVMSDIHGEQKEFFMMLEQINFNINDKLYVLGDVIDRGESGIKLLQYIMKQPNIELILGNHEEMLLTILENPLLKHWWHGNGGLPTDSAFKCLSGQDRHNIIQYLHDAPLLKTITVNKQKFVLCHAGIETDNLGFIKKEQSKDFILWSREEFLNQTINSDTKVVFGHTPTIKLNAPDRIWFSDDKKKIGIDGGLPFGYSLCCLRLDDMESFYVKKQKVLELKAN
ncbi:MAG: metallophosphoesterase [Candidatus Woesearchaeota archaeon]